GAVSQLLPPPSHRLIAQTRPSGPISTPAVDPHFLPSGSCAQLRTVWYGLGTSLTGATVGCCADVVRIDMAPAMTRATRTIFARMICDIASLPICVHGQYANSDKTERPLTSRRPAPSVARNPTSKIDARARTGNSATVTLCVIGA